MTSLLFYYFTSGEVEEAPQPQTSEARDQFIADFNISTSLTIDVSIATQKEVSASITTEFEFSFER